MKTIIREYSQIISTSRWVRKVELCYNICWPVFLRMALTNTLRLWQRTQPFNTALLLSKQPIPRWEHIVTMKTDFGLKVVTEKSLLHMHKVNMWSAQALTPWKPACSSFSLPKIASLIRPSKTSLQTLTDNLTLDQKWVSFEQFEVNLL